MIFLPTYNFAVVVARVGHLRHGEDVGNGCADVDAVLARRIDVVEALDQLERP